MVGKRAAIIIGVNRTGGMDPLVSPSAEAQRVGRWLKKEGFEKVVVLTDEDGEQVKSDDIRENISDIVREQTYDLLVLYFSGHGLWKNQSELWLLSGAPNNADEAINVTENREFARDCNIPTVVLISDACRSVPKTSQQNKMRGRVVFPNEIPRAGGKVDCLYASILGTPAYELPIDAADGRKSVFTHCLLKAFEDPDPDMVLTLERNGVRLEVVPNRRLEKYLRREVKALVSKFNITLEQDPVAEVTSADEVFIAKVLRPAPRRPAASPAPLGPGGGGAGGGSPVRPGDRILGGTPGGALPTTRRLIRFGSSARSPSGRPAAGAGPGGGASDEHLAEGVPVTPSEIALVRYAQALQLPPPFSDLRLAEIDAAADADREHAALAPEQENPRQKFESRTGLAVTGATVIDGAVSDGWGDFEALPINNAQSEVRLWPSSASRAGSVVLRFEEGGTALAAFPGFIGHVAIVDGSVATVSYVPSSNTPRWQQYVEHHKDIELLRASVAAAARHGVFGVTDRRAAGLLADRIRLGKSIDPTLGIYAAYAYSSAGLDEEVRSIAQHMHTDLGVIPFDVALLGRRADPEMASQPVAPFCPMLAQGWNFFRSHRVSLPPLVEDAQDELKPGLWTTFESACADRLIDAVRKGLLP